MKFPNQSKSLRPISREYLLELCKRFGKDGRKLPKYGDLNEETFPLYMTAITGFRPCPICNGPRGIVKLDDSRVYRMLYLTRMMTSQTLAIYSPIRCLDYPVHSLIERSKDPLSNWERNTCNLCDHGLYFIECKDCRKNLKEVKHAIEMVRAEA